MANATTVVIVERNSDGKVHISLEGLSGSRADMEVTQLVLALEVFQGKEPNGVIRLEMMADNSMNVLVSLETFNALLE